MKDKEILIGVTGSIAAYKAAEVVSALKKEGAKVTVILTRAAREFVGPITFQTLSRRPVISDLFEDATDWDPEHTAMAQRASLLAVLPATANFLGKYAHGIADDPLTTTALAVSCPVLVAPAMNDRMWDHPAVRENVRILKERGVRVVEPDEGELACGAVGPGRLAEPVKILDQIRRLTT